MFANNDNVRRRSPRLLAHKKTNSIDIDLSRFAYVGPASSSSSITATASARRMTSLSAKQQQQNEDGVKIKLTGNVPQTPSRRKRSNSSTAADKEDATCTAPSTPKKKRSPTPRKSPTSRIEPGSLKPPRGWQSIYTLVEELRADRTAPVDSDGAEALPQKDRGEPVYRFQVLIALMLSSQTKDAVVGDAMRKLQKHGLDVENIRATSSEVLNELIYSVGFRNNKTKYIKDAAETIATKYNGDIPPNADELMTLAGVGPKMAYIVESIAFNTTSGIGVDTHMHRMFNQLKWVNSTTPEKTRVQLEGWLPRERWGEINYLWVGLGQEVQQQKGKILKKAIQCSRPKEAIGLLKRLGMDCRKEAKKFDLVDELAACVMSKSDRVMSDIDGAGPIVEQKNNVDPK